MLTYSRNSQIQPGNFRRNGFRRIAKKECEHVRKRCRDRERVFSIERLSSRRLPRYRHIWPRSQPCPPAITLAGRRSDWRGRAIHAQGIDGRDEGFLRNTIFDDGTSRVVRTPAISMMSSIASAPLQ